MLSLGGIAYYHGIQGWELERTADWLFNHLYFDDPIWISLHNALHAPILLLLGIAAVWRTHRNIGSRSRWPFWFFLACLLHSGIDIFTHADDGPLVNAGVHDNNCISYTIHSWKQRTFKS